MFENGLSRFPVPKNLTFDTKMGTIGAIEKKLEKTPTTILGLLKVFFIYKKEHTSPPPRVVNFVPRALGRSYLKVLIEFTLVNFFSRWFTNAPGLLV